MKWYQYWTAIHTFEKGIIWSSIWNKLHDGNTNTQSGRDKRTLRESARHPLSLPLYLLGISFSLLEENVWIVLSEYLYGKIYINFFPSRNFYASEMFLFPLLMMERFHAHCTLHWLDTVQSGNPHIAGSTTNTISSLSLADNLLPRIAYPRAKQRRFSRDGRGKGKPVGHQLLPRNE